MPHKSVDVENTRTIEGLSLMINWNEQMIQEFQEYARKQWLYKKQPDVIDSGIEYLNQNL